MFYREISSKIISLLDDGKPVIITGARQVGKTTVAKQLSNSYSNSIYINLEQDSRFKDIVEHSDLDFDDIFKEYCIIKGITIDESTLIIFDEIQFCSKLITALKYFYESGVPNHIIATGSNLGLSTNRRSEWSFPVGKVNHIQMFPMTFKEFLYALSKDGFIEYISKGVNGNVMSQAIHEEILRLFDLYTNLGGMPEVVKKYLESNDLRKGFSVQENLMIGYSTDILKYSDSNTSSRIYDIYKNVDVMLKSNTQKFKITSIDAYTYKDISTPLSWLIESGLIHICYNINNINLPLRSNIKENNFKLFYSDVGILMRKSGYILDSELINNDKIYLGVVIENYFANIIKYNQFELFCYKRNTSEVDFLIQDNQKVIPIEVKSGNNTKAKSLSIFVKEYDCKKAYKFSRNNFSINGNIHCYPVYSFEFIPEFDNYYI